MSTQNTDRNNNALVVPVRNPKVRGKGNIVLEAGRFINLRSPGKEMTVSEPTECICNRKIMGILCRSCGNVFRGRVRQICSYHPNSRYLMDYEVCPVCKATQFCEFKEITDMDCEKERNT